MHFERIEMGLRSGNWLGSVTILLIGWPARPCTTNTEDNQSDMNMVEQPRLISVHLVSQLAMSRTSAANGPQTY